MKFTQFVRDFSAQGIRRNICYRTQQIMHETRKIWHPREQNYLSVPFNKR